MSKEVQDEYNSNKVIIPQEAILHPTYYNLHQPVPPVKKNTMNDNDTAISQSMDDCQRFKLTHFLKPTQAWGDVPLDFKIEQLAKEPAVRTCSRPNTNPFQSTWCQVPSSYPPPIPLCFAEEIRRKREESERPHVEKSSATPQSVTLTPVSPESNDKSCNDKSSTSTSDTDSEDDNADNDDDDDDNDDDGDNNSSNSSSNNNNKNNDDKIDDNNNSNQDNQANTKVETIRMLSKKEQKAKELKELEALLAAELGELDDVTREDQISYVSDDSTGMTVEEKIAVPSLAEQAALAFLGGGAIGDRKKKAKKKKKKTASTASAVNTKTKAKSKIKLKANGAAAMASKIRAADKGKGKKKKSKKR